MKIYYYIAVCSLLVYALFTIRFPRREKPYHSIAALIALIYVFVRVHYFDGHWPTQIMCILSFTLIGLCAFRARFRELFFASAFSAYVLHAVVMITYVLPLPARWINGDLAPIRMLMIGLVQVAGAWAWAYCAPRSSEKRRRTIMRVVIVLAIILENYRLIRAVLPAEALSEYQRIYRVWNFLEVEMIGMFLLFESYYMQLEEAIRQTEFLRRQQEMWRMKAEQQGEMRRLIHDLRHQIELIQSMDSEAATVFAQLLNRQAENYIPLPESGNLMLDAVLNEKIRKCQSNGIVFQTEVNVVNSDWIDPLDIDVLFGNAIENAMEAVAQLKEDLRWIQLKIHENNTLLLIKISNPYSGLLSWSSGELVTSKNEKSSHGYGLKSIRKIVEKYSGTIKIETDDHLFQLSIALTKPMAK